jgi:hypothetical protein
MEKKQSPEYIQGAKDRARKIAPPWLASNQYLEGYQWMESLLSPIETEIMTQTLRYKTVAESQIRELENDSVRPAAEPKFSTEQASCDPEDS